MYRKMCVMKIGIVVCWLLTINVFVSADPSGICADVADIPLVECEALVTFYAATNGDAWTNNTGWLTSETPCNWYGVNCRNGHVTEVSLRKNLVSGELPKELADLANLLYLDLGDNQITGTLPPEIGYLKHLKGLKLRNNRLQGNLPQELGELAQLEWLYVSQNDFSGVLPIALQHLPRLQTLYFLDTQLCEPLEPTFQAWLRNIRSLGRSGTLCNCAAITEIPANECRALFSLYYRTQGDQWNSSAGWLQTLSPCTWEHVTCEDGHVTALTLDKNNIEGQLPPEIGHLTNLKTLDMSDNHIRGPVPTEIGALTALRTLDLRNNSLKGSLPEEIGALRELRNLDLSHNRLEGSLPLTLGDLANVQTVSLQHNTFAGTLPPNLGNLSQLTSLDLSHNQFLGALPATFNRMQNLTGLDVSYTTLRGALPESLTHLTSLTTLQFQQTNVCTLTSDRFGAWLKGIATVKGTGRDCPAIYQGLLPLILLLCIGGALLLPATYQAGVEVFGDISLPAGCAPDFQDKGRIVWDGPATHLLMAGLFALSVEFLWNVITLFDLTSLFWGLGTGLMLYLGYIIVSRRVNRQTRILWVGRILGLMVSLFLAAFMLLTVDRPFSTSDILSIAAYLALITLPVWFMTSCAMVGGYWEIAVEGMLLGGLWGALTGGLLGEVFCDRAAAIYGGMSDILMYQVLSDTLPDTVCRFWANELTGIFLFSIMGACAGALTRSLKRYLTVMRLPVHGRLINLLIPIFRRLNRKT